MFRGFVSHVNRKLVKDKLFVMKILYVLASSLAENKLTSSCYS